MRHVPFRKPNICKESDWNTAKEEQGIVITTDKLKELLGYVYTHINTNEIKSINGQTYKFFTPASQYDYAKIITAPQEFGRIDIILSNDQEFNADNLGDYWNMEHISIHTGIVSELVDYVKETVNISTPN